MTVRNETEALAQVICDKWAQKIGWGFHLDNAALDYDPPLDPKDADAYDADMATLFELVEDPYEFGVAALKKLEG